MLTRTGTIIGCITRCRYISRWEKWGNEVTHGNDGNRDRTRNGTYRNHGSRHDLFTAYVTITGEFGLKGWWHSIGGSHKKGYIKEYNRI
jgi:hypothetical protein